MRTNLYLWQLWLKTFPGLELSGTRTSQSTCGWMVQTSNFIHLSGKMEMKTILCVLGFVILLRCNERNALMSDLISVRGKVSITNAPTINLKEV